MVCGPSIEDAHNQVQKIKESVDGFELRLDLFHDFSPEAVAELMVLPTIITWKGASWDDLKKILALKPACIDLDASTSEAVFEKVATSFPQTQMICSIHDFEKTPDDLHALLNQIQNRFAHHYKIATYAHSACDALRMLLFVKERGCIGVCMGEHGQLSRQLAPVVGAPWMYGAADETNIAAPGQLTVEALKNTYRFSELNQCSKVYGLLGNPVSQSPSHIIHNAALKELGQNALYVKIALQKEELSPFFNAITDLPFCGFSVTIPFKEALISIATQCDPKVQAITALNTLVKRGKEWHGYNTDATGALDAIEQHIPVAHKRLVILGAGGSAKAIAFEALERGAHVTIQNRTEQKAYDLASRLGCTGMAFTEIPYDILVNTTPVSMPIPEEWIAPKTVVMDLFPRAGLTPLLEVANAKGCTSISGFEMFLLQAAEQFALWFPECSQQATQALQRIGAAHAARSEGNGRTLQ